jgi:DNA topoisomerase-1
MSDAMGSRRRWILRVGTPKSGFRYTLDGRPVRAAAVARIKALVIPPAWREVHIAFDSRASVQAWGYDVRGRKQYRYSAQATERGALRKFHRVTRLGSDLPRIRLRVSVDGRGMELTKRRVVASVVRLIAEGYLRVGSDRYEKENGSFGTTTLRKKHVTVHGRNRIEFHYPGKRLVEQRHIVVDRRLAAFIAQCKRTPGPRLFRYETPEGWCDLTARDVNRYLHELVGVPYTAKDFRTWGGTLTAAVQLAEAGPAESEREAKKNVVAAVRAVAEELGNTPAISRKSYVHPIVIAQYLDHGHTITVNPTWVRQGRLTPAERALAAFLREHFPDRRRRRREEVQAA